MAIRIARAASRPGGALPPCRGAVGRLLLALTTLAAFWLSACAPHSGGDEIAYLRNGQLWTIYRDGSSALEVAQGGIVGFAWSPDHHQLVLRFTGRTPSPTSAASAPDALSDLAVTGVDGGTPVQITPQVSGMARSDAWWDASGNRLLYREGFPAGPGQEPSSVVYVLSQADQPGGIARKPLLDVALVPALAPDGSQVAVVDAEGNVRAGKPGAAGAIVASGALLTLPGGTRPARLLWRPARQELLYAAAGPNGAVQLTLITPAGKTEAALDVSDVRDYAFSPDGNALLVQTARGFAVWMVSGSRFGTAPSFTWPESDSTVLAWWSPTSRAVLVQDHTGYSLADPRARRVTLLLRTSDGAALSTTASWHPVAGSPWNATGDAFVFRDTGSGTWLGRPLARPQGVAGLYVGSVGNSSAPPALIDSGDDWAPSWSNLDPGASWLTPS